MSRSAVSVALCSYNGERYIEAQLHSILRQTLAPAEVVVADDGSTDDTLPIVRRVAASSPVPFRILPDGGRLGVTANFQRAVEAARLPYIALADQDDVWHPERLAMAVAVLDADPRVLLVHSDARLVDADGRALGFGLVESLSPRRAELALLASGAPLEAYLRRNFVTGTTVTFRAALRDAAVPFPPSWVHDEWLAVVAAVRGRVVYLDRALVDYRQHGGNQIGMATPSTRRRLARLLEPRGDRLLRLQERSAVLAERLARFAEPHDARELVAKAAFEASRAAYPAGRVRRIVPVLGQAVTGRYTRFASQGLGDVVRDLVQPAS